MTRRLYVDGTSPTVLIKCHDCPWWWALRFTRLEAWKAGRDHELRAHPGATQATTRIDYYLRHAER